MITVHITCDICGKDIHNWNHPAGTGNLPMANEVAGMHMCYLCHAVFDKHQTIAIENTRQEVAGNKAVV